MTVRFITAWNGYSPGDTYTYSTGGPVEATLIAEGLARNAADNDNAGETDLQSQITAIASRLSAASSTYANDAAAAAGGVPVGGIYNVAGKLAVRLS